jgi:hypothetical protein
MSYIPPVAEARYYAEVCLLSKVLESSGMGRAGTIGQVDFSTYFSGNRVDQELD